MKNVLILLSILLFVSCDDGSIENFRNINHNVNIYLVKEGQLSLHNREVGLDTLELEHLPWIKSSEIEFYDWSAHAFYFTKEFKKADHSGRSVVVASGDKRLFRAIFWPMYMSSFPSAPAIFPEDGWFVPGDVLRFNSFGWYGPGELNDNLEFKSELSKSGLLREGIEVKLSGLRRTSASSVKYTFEITNKETDNIYVLDPEKMGASRFHYYTNGVSFRKDNKHYNPAGFDTTSSEEINARWYCKILPGSTISRTLEIDGFESLPSGKVVTYFHFPGAYHLDAKEWKKSDGRIWIGDYRVETEMLLD